jgi:hypothetical protein
MRHLSNGSPGWIRSVGVRPALRQPPVELVLKHNGVSTIQRLAAASLRWMLRI